MYRPNVKQWISLLSTAFVLLSLASFAQAGPVLTFNLAGGSGTVASIVQSQSSSTLTVTPNSTAPAELLSLNSTGVGVVSGVEILGVFIPVDLDPTQVEVVGSNESVKFAMTSKTVGPWILESITFAVSGLGTGSATEQFSLLVDGKAVPGVFTINPGGASGSFAFSLGSLPIAQRTGSLFEVVPGDGDSDFRIGSITVQETPEPTSIAVFGIMAAGAFYGWRRRRQVEVA